MIASILKWLFIRYNKKVLNRKYFDSKLYSGDLKNVVRIYCDKWLIPTIYSRDRSDLFFAQGYIHARDRLWQIEMNRRVSSGTLAEVFGSSALNTDKLTRTLGFRRVAEKEISKISQESLSAIQSYVLGINHFIKNKNYPIEFRLTGFTPRYYHPVDILTWGKFLSWSMSHGWSGALVRQEILDAVGEDLALELDIMYPEENPTVLPDGLEIDQIQAGEFFDSIHGPFIQKDLEGGGRGSNSWAVSGSFTETGKPILANDTHLPLSTPGLWYLNQLHCSDGIHVSGASIPGIPGIIIGHNDRIAWGITLAYTDCEDVFIEKINPSNKNEYQHDGKMHTFKVYEELINIKDKEPIALNIKSTIHGPLIGKVIEDKHNSISLCSMALQQSDMFTSFLGINAATNFESFSDSIQKLDSPQLNFVYADTEGNIGFRMSGAVPIRKSGTGELPKAGWTGEFDWFDTVPFSKMPYCLNPSQKFIISTNNKPVEHDYPYYLGNSFMNGYRAKRIESMLKTYDNITVDNCQSMMMDTYCLPGEILIEGLIRKFRSARPKSQKLISILLEWDYYLDIYSVGGAAYEVLIYYLIRNLLEPKLGKNLTDKYMGSGQIPLLVPVNELLGHTIPAFIKIIQSGNSKWIKTTADASDLVDKSLEDACTWLEKNLGYEPDTWEWGKIHTSKFIHTFSVKKIFDNIFSSASFPIPGDTDTIHQSAYNPNSPYTATSWCPNFRMIIDLENFDNTRMIAPPGNSGVIGSTYYHDQLNPWLEGKSINLPWSEKKIVENARYKLIFNPAQK